MPQVFISYRQIDDAQRSRVRSFAELLRDRGVEVIFDQFYKDSHPSGPPEGWPKWCSDQAEHAEKIIIIGDAAWFRCYKGKENSGAGLGAACEAGVIRQRIYELGGIQDVVRIAHFEQSDVDTIPLDLKRYDRFHLLTGIDQLCAWAKGSQIAQESIQETKPLSIRFWSTRESVVGGEVSILAIIETLLAVALLFVMTLWVGTQDLIAGACMIAPLTLLRTPDSVQFGLKWYKRHFFSWWMMPVDVIAVILAVYLNHEVRKSLPGMGLLTIPLGWGTLVVAVHWPKYFLIRTGSVMRSFILTPITAIKSIPVNWRRIVFSEDSLVPIEFLPGQGEGPLNLVRRNVFSERGRRQNHRLPFIAKWARIGVYTVGFVFLTIMTSLYRWSLKATCLIYLPLVWLANKAQYTPRSFLRNMLHDYLIDDIQRVRRWLAWLSFCALTLKILIWWHLDEVRAWAHEHMPEWALKIAHDWHHYLDPEHVPWWQITPALNGMIALGMMVYARRVLYLRDDTPPDAVVLRNWRIMNVLSGVLSIYTIVCVLLLTWKAGDLLATLNKVWHMLDHKVLP